MTVDEWTDNSDPTPPLDGEETYRFEYDDDRSVTETVVEAVVTVANVDPSQARIRFHGIDLDALDNLFTDEDAFDSESPPYVTFHAWDLRVVVAGDGTVLIRPWNDAESDDGRGSEDQ